MSPLMRILLVEDSPKDAELTLSALEESNLANEVVIVRDGAEALDYLFCRGKFENQPHSNPVVVFLDLKLPKLNGLEVLRRMKEDANLRKIPVVMVTSSREEEDLVKSYELGVNAYVVKPIGFRQFTDAVKQIGAFWAILNEPPPNSVRKEEA